ncbi:aminomethyl-transferring glycine dehydrogenase subunit GcvPA [bacterium]|nr:aminomethyl-transferring glycine dehydrogenase subunit GcvPA [candidate division CSSED10-310 bacterium]
MRYIPLTQDQRRQILKEIGVSSVEELFESIPSNLRLNQPLDLPPSLSEWAVQRLLTGLAESNADSDKSPCFLGAGAYRHYIPAVVSSLGNRQEFVTAYTPYQPEVSQGTLQALFEYQTMMTQLTGLPVSNASMYDGAMATAEAALLAFRTTKKSLLAVSRALAPGYRKTLETYTRHQEITIRELPVTPEGRTDPEAVQSVLKENPAAILIQSPNFFGVIEDLSLLSSHINNTGSMLITVVNEAVSLGILKSPGDTGADIVCGDAHSMGLPISYGGPYLGFMTVKEKFLRQIPGRVVGMTVDKDRRTGFVNTLSTREQHIRREKATSNICTNQALCATVAGIFMATLGRKGLRELAFLNMKKSAYLKQRIGSLKNCRLTFTGPTFNEFAVTLNEPVERINRKLTEKGIIGGYDLSPDYPEYPDTVLLCATELTTREHIDNLISILEDLGRVS